MIQRGASSGLLLWRFPVPGLLALHTIVVGLWLFVFESRAIPSPLRSWAPPRSRSGTAFCSIARTDRIILMSDRGLSSLNIKLCTPSSSWGVTALCSSKYSSQYWSSYSGYVEMLFIYCSRSGYLWWRLLQMLSIHLWNPLAMCTCRKQCGIVRSP